jgi:putative peptidoglycan lipid II flippase
MAFTLPAAVALFVIPFFIIDATVTRGAFTSEDAARTADVLRNFAWGVPAFVLAKVLTPPFFAREDTRRPMIFSIASVAITVALGSALFFGMEQAGMDGVVGLAIATSTSAWINVALLGGVLVKEEAWNVTGRFLSRFVRVLAASLAMAAVLVPASIFYDDLARLFLAKEVAVLVVCGAGALVYGVCIVLFRAVSPAELKAVLRREPGASTPSGLD